MPNDPELLKIAVEIVLRAGEMQMMHFGRDVQIRKKGIIDLVTQVDIEIEQMARKKIGEKFPSHAVLAEELSDSSSSEIESSGYCWIFDPIDGTVNYAHGLPIFCSSLAIEVDGHVEIGVVYDPTREELFVAQRGSGASLNGTPLLVSSTPILLDSILCTGFPYDIHDMGDDVISLFGAFVKQARAVRRLGSAALDLCYVAAGRLDGFWEQRLQAWDIAAGALLVKEAGGCVTDLSGRDLDIRIGDVLASNCSLHGQMCEIIRNFVANNLLKRKD